MRSFVAHRHIAPLVESFSEGYDACLIESVFRHAAGRFYLDLAANDPIRGSNTYLLDRVYNWSGVCIEPQQKHGGRFVVHRTCQLVQSVVSDVPVSFVEHRGSGLTSGISGLDNKHEPGQPVPVASIRDILRVTGTPRRIDYLSLDCEGSELNVMNSFPFAEHSIGAMTVVLP